MNGKAFPQLSKYQLLSLMLIIFFLTRFFVMLTSMDTLFDSEDLAMGTVAKEVIKGPVLPLFEYQYLPYSGGTLIVGLLAIPFFLLLGPNYFALKLVPLFFSGATLAVVFLFAYEFFGRRAAIITSVLYLFSSTAWGGFNFFLGFHTESLSFSFLALYLFYGIIFGHKRSWQRCLLFGIVCGFGTYFSYTFLVMLFAMFIVMCLQDKFFFKRKGFYIFSCGFLAGFLPWIAYNFAYHFRGVTDVLLQLSNEKNYVSLQSWIASGYNYLKSLWFAGLFDHEFLPRFFSKLYGMAYCLLYWVCFLYILFRRARPLKKLFYSKEFLILIFPFILLFAARLYGVDSETSALTETRYLMGLFPIVFLTVAIALDELFREHNVLKKSISWVFCAIVSVGAVGFLARANYAAFGNGFKKLGYSYYYLAETFNSNHQNDFYKILDNITKLSEPERYEALTLRLTIDLSYPLVQVPFGEYQKLRLRLDEKYRAFFYKILIKGLYYNTDLEPLELIKEVGKLSEQVEVRYKPFLYEGIGALMIKRYPDEPVRCREAAAFMKDQYRPYYYRGLSEPLYCDDIPAYLQRCRALIRGMDSADLPVFFDGMGEILGKFAVNTFMVGLDYENKGIIKLYRFFDTIDPLYRQDLLRGAAQSLAYFYTPNTKGFIEAFLKYFKESEMAYLTKIMHETLGK